MFVDTFDMFDTHPRKLTKLRRIFEEDLTKIRHMFCNKKTHELPYEALFSTGAQAAKDCKGSYLLDPGNPGQALIETPEERQERTVARKEELLYKNRRKSRRHHTSGGRDSLQGFSSTVHPPQTDWAALATAEDRQQASVEFRTLLAKRKFPPDVELLAVHDVNEAGQFAFRICGMYYELPSPVNGRRCYQKLLCSPDSTNGFCCDAVYIMWSAERSRWQISCRPVEQAYQISFRA